MYDAESGLSLCLLIGFVGFKVSFRQIFNDPSIRDCRLTACSVNIFTAYSRFNTEVPHESQNLFVIHNKTILKVQLILYKAVSYGAVTVLINGFDLTPVSILILAFQIGRGLWFACA
ncbi:hypothetical protein [Paenibacillus pseudetheri]|uniref:hypothetical protein n=1 Tax=Paenibacillus pseudetheri TaxID=2897682 RepID=UPI001F41A4F7|nr:hypothetical protein [Paenibacillus pseudetheri]